MTLQGFDVDAQVMREALRLARRGYGAASPNPMVGAVLVRAGKIIGRGWHRRAGLPHAEIEALRNAQGRALRVRGATLYVTLEPCCTHGRTPPCTDAIIAAGIRRVVAGTPDPNPRHCGRGLKILERGGVQTVCGVLAEDCERLNEAFNHWIVHRTPFVTVKAAMTLDGKIATANGESKWITGQRARQHGMRLRQGADGVLVGINTVLADDPSLTVRGLAKPAGLRRFVLDAKARTPLEAKLISDELASLTTIVVSDLAPASCVAALAKRVNVLLAPLEGQRAPRGRLQQSANAANAEPKLDLRWLMRKLGADNVTSLLVEGGGEVNASFLFAGLADRVAFYYAPKVLGGRGSRPAVGGQGVSSLLEAFGLEDVEWRRLGPDLRLIARVTNSHPRARR